MCRGVPQKGNTDGGGIKMGKRKGLEVSIAAAEAVALADVDVVAAYPITPQTHIVEHLAELVNNGELDAEFVPVESEHSALSVCVGASAAGARAFTCTSAQGLALMNEIVYIASSMRLPIVMILANRSLSAPLSIWNDHSDAMSVRDTGWIQVFTQNGQEIFDHIFFAYRVGEDPRVSLPVMLHMDGFILTHMIEPVEFWSQDQVKAYLPPFRPINRLDPERPVTMGAFAMPHLFTETKYAQDVATAGSMPVILSAWEEMEKVTGRRYFPVERYRTEDAETIFVVQGSFAETISAAVDELRAKGQPVGLIMQRLWRPFPFELFREAVKGSKDLIVIDRAISFGGQGGPLAIELRSSLFGMEDPPKVTNFICGLGGRDVTVDDFIKIYERAKEKTAKKSLQEDFEFYGVRS